MTPRSLKDCRRDFHAALFEGILTVTANGVASNADSSSAASKRIAAGMIARIGQVRTATKMAGQTMGSDFETVCANFLQQTLDGLSHLRPGTCRVAKGGGIAGFDQYAHLDELEAIARSNVEIATALGSDYLIKPDIVIARAPLDDATINAGGITVDTATGRLSPLRAAFGAQETLHASISCKWTLRSDRAQNARSEGLNLVRNRKGRLPHIAVVTAEPLPSRIASLALGTGDIDCVYHFALDELQATLAESGDTAYLDQLMMMIDGRRLRDIADLPLDLLV